MAKSHGHSISFDSVVLIALLVVGVVSAGVALRKTWQKQSEAAAKKKLAIESANLALAAQDQEYLRRFGRERLKKFREDFPIEDLSDRIQASFPEKLTDTPELSEVVQLRLRENEQMFERLSRRAANGSRVSFLSKVHDPESVSYFEENTSGPDRDGWRWPEFPVGFGKPWMRGQPFVEDSWLCTSALWFYGEFGEDREPETLGVEFFRNEKDVDWNQVHFSAEWDFLHPEGFGHLISDRRAIGFRSHGFHDRLVVNSSMFWSWKLKGIHLINLYRDPEARAYVWDKMPRLDTMQAGKVETRALSDFESKGLEALKFERDVVVGESNQAGVRMIGSLRANETCLKCHQVPRGTLLGAFSYEFVFER